MLGRIQSRLNHTRSGKTLLTILALFAISLISFHPLMGKEIPVTADGLLHLHRMIGLEHAMSGWNLWPRFAPGMMYGYGSPIFNYYAPLYLYPFVILHQLGLSSLSAFLGGILLLNFFGIVGAYLLGRSLRNELTGIVSALAFGYAPYVIVNWLHRGAIPEFVGLMLLPWIFWCLWRVAFNGRRRDVVLAILFYGLLVPTHHISALINTPIILGWCFYLWWICPQPRQRFWLFVLAILLPIGLTTFYWLPTLGELDYVRIGAGVDVSSAEFQTHFLRLTEIFSLPKQSDLTRFNPPIPLSLGWIQVLLSLSGFGLLHFHPTYRHSEYKPLRYLYYVCGTLTISLIFLITKSSTLLWEILTLLDLVLFPWRLLGPASFLLAITGGLGAWLLVELIRQPYGQYVFIGVLIGGMILYALPWLYTAYLPDPQSETISDFQDFERDTGWVATTSYGEFIPKWVIELPSSQNLIGLFAEDDVIPRLQPNLAIRVHESEWSDRSSRLEIEAYRDTTLTFNWVYFPGWKATLDGESIEVTPSEPQGLLQLPLPAGEHELEIRFGETRLRMIAVILSGVTLLITFVLFSPLPLWKNQYSAQVIRTDFLVLPLFALCLVIGTGLLGLKSFWFDRTETIFNGARFSEGVETGLDVPIYAQFDHAIELMGYDLKKNRVPSGGSTIITLYWRTGTEPIRDDYNASIFLRDEAGNIILMESNRHPGGAPTSNWVPDTYVQDDIRLTIPAGTPPGRYSIHVDVYSPTSDHLLDVFDRDDNPRGVSIPIGPLDVVEPTRSARVNQLPLSDEVLSISVDPTLTLIAVEPLPEEAEVGAILPITWYWQANRIPVTGQSARLVWINADEEVIASTPSVELVAGYPTQNWKRRDLWKGIHYLYVPGRLEAGTYQVGIEVLDSVGMVVAEPIIISEMRATTPVRIFSQPDLDALFSARWSNTITLSGILMGKATNTPDDVMRFRLAWSAQEEITESYTVFIHLIDNAGNIIAQQDTIPFNGTRPTTGWAPGEYVTDPYTLYIPPETLPGTYQIRVGWYNPATGERLLRDDGTDTFILPITIQVSP